MYDVLGVVLLAASSEKWWVELVVVLRWPATSIIIAFMFRKIIESLVRRMRELRRGQTEILLDAEAALDVATTTTAAPTTTTAAPTTTTGPQASDGVAWAQDDRKMSAVLYYALFMHEKDRSLVFFLGTWGSVQKEQVFSHADVMGWDQESLDRFGRLKLVAVEGDTVQLTELGRDFIRVLGRSGVRGATR